MSTRQRTNRHGVLYYVDGDDIHCQYYVGDGVTLSRTFSNLTQTKIDALTFEDLVWAIYLLSQGELFPFFKRTKPVGLQSDDGLFLCPVLNEQIIVEVSLLYLV